MKKSILSNTLTIMGIVTIGLIILGRIHLIWQRHIDSDEFAHLHWAYLIATGHHPYKEFFFYILPLFQWVLAPFFFFSYGPWIIFGARYLMLGIFLLSVYLLARITYTITQSLHASILSAILVLIFPMTLDKTIDVRPDMLMMACFLYTIVLLINTPSWTEKTLILAGTSITLSGLILSKMIVGVPAFLFLFFALYWRQRTHLRIHHAITMMILGAMIPLLTVFLYLLFSELLPAAYHALTIDAFIVNEGKIPFSLWESLSPWPLVYVGTGGPSIPWGVSTGLWLCSIIGIIVMLCTEWIMGLFVGIFFLTGWLFLRWFPAPYTQYFLPFTFFASLSVAYMLHQTKKLFFLFLPIACIISLVSFWQQYSIRSYPKGNEEQIDVINHILQISSPTDTMFDMVGSYIVRPDAYYFCCHPYPEFIDHMPSTYPPLRTSLIEKKTPFLVMDQTGFLFWKTPPEDKAFIKQHYLPYRFPKIYSTGAHVVCTTGSCTQLDIDGQPVPTSGGSFLLISDGTYEITTTPAGVSLSIDGAPTHPIQRFASGTHTFLSPPGISSFTVQLLSTSF